METIDSGAPKTPYMGFGDTVHIEVTGRDGVSLDEVRDVFARHLRLIVFGGVLGAVFLRGSQWFITAPEWRLLSSALGVLLVLLILPGGSQGDAIVEAIAALADRIVFAPWDSDPEPYGGPLISNRAASAALQALQQRIDAGGRVIRASGLIEGLSGAFVQPSIIDTTGVDVPDEEIFAPFLQVRRVPDFESALREANATKYGLSAGLVSDDPANWQRFIHRIRAGVVNFNRPTTGAAGDMPFGGLGQSGNHRPSAYYAADYCAYPVASFEADGVKNIESEIKGLRA